MELEPYRINVNSISPGAVETDIYNRIRTPEQVKEFEETATKASFVGRLGNTQDIANSVMLLAPDDSSCICGENIVIDGGG